MPHPAVQLEQVIKRYDAEGPAVLDAIDLSIAPGESVAIVGPSGCGKSTLLNLVGTLDRPTAGRVVLNGDDVTALPEKQLAPLRATRLGFVFQDHHLLPQLTALENVLLPTLALPKTQPADAAEADTPAARARQLLERVGLAEHAGKRPAQLSGGQRQRVAIVRALINEPAVLLVDEPTGALDRAAADEVVDLLAALNDEQGVTLIMVTHAERLAARMGRTMKLEQGKIHPV
ncbi:MAG: ATP-binding cassette domain-containing protein [Planctomycetes bacterium]|jgi:ABC-type lipoprotein export system ATPase subunit|nr:ATP-binding cassette domain-containing protein [Planctomycetota bacterium]